MTITDIEQSLQAFEKSMRNTPTVALAMLACLYRDLVYDNEIITGPDEKAPYVQLVKAIHALPIGGRTQALREILVTIARLALVANSNR